MENPLSRQLGDILAYGKARLTPADVYYLITHVTGRSKAFIHTHPEHAIGLFALLKWRRMVRRRCNGVPASYLTGEKEFYGLRFTVNRHCLIPRPETELIVEEVIGRNPSTLLDMGTGSGCIALASACHVPTCRVTAVDISRRALSLARQNAARLGCMNVTFLRSDYFSSLPSNRYDIIASNPPYVREGDITALSPDVAAYEPGIALYGGSDGLDAYRTILGNARDFLSPGGVLVLEISQELSDSVQHMAGHFAYRVEKRVQDLAGHERMLVLSPA
jgi:release factor glutamine methyltransferase